MMALERSCAIISATAWSSSWMRSQMANNAGYDDVLLAKKRIADFAVRTPFVESPLLGDHITGRGFLKLELFQRTGSVKFRGALNRLAMIPENARAAGVVAFSSGNHAQGVAAAA